MTLRQVKLKYRRAGAERFLDPGNSNIPFNIFNAICSNLKVSWLKDMNFFYNLNKLLIFLLLRPCVMSS
jgi:hypothetical protein